jgi:hypothetical protein
MSSAIIEVGIGLVMVFFILSIVVTQINNIIVNTLNLRAENLREWFHNTFTDEALRNEIMAHPMIGIVKTQLAIKKPNLLDRITRRIKRRIVGILVPGAQQYTATTDVSNVAPDVFANALISIFITDPTTMASLDETAKVQALIQAMKNKLTDEPPLEQTLETVLGTAQSLQDAEAKLASWFDSAMTQLSNLFKRRVQFVSFFVALLVAIILNVDTLHLARTFWNDPALRETVVIAAQRQVAVAPQNNTLPDQATLEQRAQALQESIQPLLDLRLPIGWIWSPYVPDPNDTNPEGSRLIVQSDARNAANFFPGNDTNWPGFWLYKIVGFILTTFAIMQGSDFWFNLLGRLTQARAALSKVSSDSGSGQGASG